MIRPQRYFPWRIAQKFFFGHLAFVVVTLILTGFSIRYVVYSTFLSGVPAESASHLTTDIHTALADFDAYLTNLFLLVLAAASVFFALSTRFYARPLGRLIQRARELRRFDAPLDDETIDIDELSEEPGEWYDLERALIRIHKDLRSKTDALSLEREELRALIGAVSDAILAVDRDGQALFFNPQFAMLFGVTRSPGEKGLGITEMFRVPEVLQGYRECLAHGQMVNFTATIHPPKDFLPRHFSIAIAPLQSNQDGVVDGAIGIFHDVTELKQSEQIRIEFVGNASHELRTPLTNIKGYVETVRSDLHQNRFGDAPQFLEIISRNVDRLILLVNDLLDLSTLESGAELKKVSASIREITDSALKQLETKRLARRQDIRIHLHTDRVLGDPRRLEQVLLNLVHNAIKYVPEGGTIDVEWQKSDGSTVLKVRDNGPGIALEHQSRLFERFYRVDAGRSRDQGGTGLGLSIVKHIVLKHGGTIRLNSRSGEGAEFICSFPD
jgi:two-component system phosphate regulon sensor histidine kinase PhoR